MKATILICAIVGVASPGWSQTYQNLDVEKNGQSGYNATLGRHQFQIPRRSGHTRQDRDARRPLPSPPAIVIPDEGVTGKTQKRCYATGNGNTICK